MTASITWVVLTMGNRPHEFSRLLDSLADQPGRILVVDQSGDRPSPDLVRQATDERIEVIRPTSNLGVPGGRDLAARQVGDGLLVFLDDDATLTTHDAAMRIKNALDSETAPAAISFKIVDQEGHVSRRHVPGIGRIDPDRDRTVPYFLGGASAVRFDAYASAGGYWPDLFYGHEELDLAWRIADDGGRIEYRPDIVVEHPRTNIGRHEHGWYLTGRNRVMVARRNLPWAIALPHVLAWLAIGSLRARADDSVRPYVSGWRRGWSVDVPRRPIRWSTVIRIGRAGRFPVV